MNSSKYSFEQLKKGKKNPESRCHHHATDNMTIWIGMVMEHLYVELLVDVSRGVGDPPQEVQDLSKLGRLHLPAAEGTLAALAILCFLLRGRFWNISVALYLYIFWSLYILLPKVISGTKNPYLTFHFKSIRVKMTQLL